LRLGDLVPSSIASATVLDAGGSPHRIAESYARGPALVYVVRHFGCSGCALAARDLFPRLGDLRVAGLNVWLVSHGRPDGIAPFVERHGLRARDVGVYVDAASELASAMKLRRSWVSTYGPEALWASTKARASGLRNGPPEGDALAQGGALLVDARGRVALVHRDRHLGDHLAPSAILDVALGMLVERATARA